MHTLSARNIVSENWLGKFRNQNMFVTTKDGRIEYVAASPFEVGSEMNKLYADLEVLLTIELTMSEVFFYAGMIHLVFGIGIGIPFIGLYQSAIIFINVAKISNGAVASF